MTRTSWRLQDKAAWNSTKDHAREMYVDLIVVVLSCAVGGDGVNVAALQPVKLTRDSGHGCAVSYVGACWYLVKGFR